jgi:hypothetical protein
MSFVLTDWRGADVCGLDFGFGRSVALRSPADEIVGNLMILYPRRTVEDDLDHGWEIVLPFEEQYVDMLINDPDLNQFFTFCGYEAKAPVKSNGVSRAPRRVGSRAQLREGFKRLQVWVFLNLPV